MATQTDFVNAGDTSLDMDDWATHVGAAVQALAKFFNHAVSGGTVPADILQGLIFGLTGQTTNRNGWRVQVSSGGDLVFQRNTGSEGTPAWTTRFTLPSAGGITVASGLNITNADVAALAGIVYSKLSLTNSIVNADIAAAAAISYSKLALTGSIVNADISGSAAIAWSKIATTGAIVNADVNGSAAIAYSKLNLSASIVDGDVSGGANIQQSKLEGHKINLLINGAFRIWEEGTTREAASTYPNNDDVYVCAQWTLLSDGNDVVDCSRETSVVPTDERYAIKLDVETANKKFGIIQFLEADVSIPLRGKRVCFGIEARNTGSSISGIRCALLSWNGGSDALTSDVVSSWGAGSTNPTLVANWAYVNTPAAETALSTTYTRHTLGSLTVPNDCNNLAVFIFTDDDTTTVGDFLYLAKAYLCEGATAGPYVRTDPAIDSMRAMRFFEKTHSPDVVPQDVGSDDYNGSLRIPVQSGTVPTLFWVYKVEKRVTPTVTLYNPKGGGTAGQWSTGGGSLANARVIQDNQYGAGIDNTSTGTGSTGQHYIHAKAVARL